MSPKLLPEFPTTNAPAAQERPQATKPASETTGKPRAAKPKAATAANPKHAGDEAASPPPSRARPRRAVQSEAAAGTETAVTGVASSRGKSPDKMTSNKSTSDKSTSDKSTSDKSTSDKSTSDKSTSDKSTSDKSSPNKTMSGGGRHSGTSHEGSGTAALAEGGEPVDFSSLGLNAALLAAVKRLGWTSPTEVQIRCFQPAREGRDLIVQSRTGTGKTGAFALPILQRLDAEAQSSAANVGKKPGLNDASTGEKQGRANGKQNNSVRALILAPTRELALQSAKQMEELGQRSSPERNGASASKGTSASKTHKSGQEGAPVRVTTIYGGASMQKQIDDLSAGASLVSGTPGRVLDLLERGILVLDGLNMLVLDEADEMLSMGFARELQAIMKHVPEERQTLLFSATIDEGVKRLGARYLRDPLVIHATSDEVDTSDLKHEIFTLSGMARTKDLIRVLDHEDPKNAIIFCNTKAETDEVSAALQRAGFAADRIHGDVPQGERERVLSGIKEGRIRFLVATDVAARGVDIPALSHVIHYSFPDTPEVYVHRAGRTGRAGSTGTVISLGSPHAIGALYALRLQYGLRLQERTLPSEGDARARNEQDVVEALLHRFGRSVPDVTLAATVLRLAQHPRSERVIAGLIAHVMRDMLPEADTEHASDGAETLARRRRGRESRGGSAAQANGVQPRDTGDRRSPDASPLPTSAQALREGGRRRRRSRTPRA